MVALNRHGGVMSMVKCLSSLTDLLSVKSAAHTYCGTSCRCSCGHCGQVTLRLYYCHIMEGQDLGLSGLPGIRSSGLCHHIGGDRFGWCMTLNWTHQGSLRSVWDIYSFSPFLSVWLSPFSCCPLHSICPLSCFHLLCFRWDKQEQIVLENTQ